MSTGIGDVVGGRYELRSLIGEGGMGRVLRARDRVLDRDVAVKVLRIDAGAEPGAAARLRREALRAAQVRHPNVVGVLDAVLDGDHPAVVLELVEGPTLADVVPDGGLDVEDAVWLLAGIAEGLQAAHGKGLVHRDVKPSNVLLDGGVPRVVDFGIARDLAATATATTTLRGSVAYLAPEQVHGGDVGPAADLYALGCLAHHLLLGSPPFRGDTPAATVAQHLGSPAPSLGARRPDVPAHVVAVVDQMLAKDPVDRPASAGSVAAALRDPRRRTGPATTRLPAPDAPTEHVAASSGAASRGRPAWQDAPDRDGERSLAGRRGRRVPWGPLLALALVVGAAVAVALAVSGRLPGLGTAAVDDAPAAPASSAAPAASTEAASSAPATEDAGPTTDPGSSAAPDEEDGDVGDGGVDGEAGDAAAAALAELDGVAALLDTAQDDGSVDDDVADEVDGHLDDAADAIGEDTGAALARLDAAVGALQSAASDGRADGASVGALTSSIRSVQSTLRADG